MTTLLYFDIGRFGEGTILPYLSKLPGYMQQEITRYRLEKDQKLRLAARLMLRHCLGESGALYLMEKVRRDAFNKPYLEDWNAFNISHSGDLVVFCHDKNPVGVDIEKREEIDIRELIGYLHVEEQQYIISSPNSSAAFYEIWAKKEALLKALGIGLTDRLFEFNCTGEQVPAMNTLRFLHKFDIHPEYCGWLCSLSKQNAIVCEFKLDRIHNKL